LFITSYSIDACFMTGKDCPLGPPYPWAPEPSQSPAHPKTV
jgi:hypothetical protein